MRALAALGLAFLALVTLAASAKADSRNREPTVAVLSFVASQDALAMYGKPVADAVARELSAISGEHAEALPLTGDVPEGVRLVVDGRILAASDGHVRLEARLRDPRRGTAQPPVVTKAGPLTEIDTLAENLAQKLAPGIRRTPEKTKTTIPEQPKRKPKPKPPTTAVRLPTAVVVFPDAPKVARDALATRLAALVRRLGYAPMVSRAQRGIVGPAAARKAIAETGAVLVVMMDVSDLDFVPMGVLTAHGRARIVVVGKNGRAVFDRYVATDTVVGSRGDGRAALSALVAEQLVIIAAPAVKRAVAR